MSLCSNHFIFIGWVGQVVKFFRVHRNFDFYPTNGIFSENGKNAFLKNAHFWLHDDKNSVQEPNSTCIGLICWIRVQMIIS